MGLMIDSLNFLHCSVCLYPFQDKTKKRCQEFLASKNSATPRNSLTQPIKKTGIRLASQVEGIYFICVCHQNGCLWMIGSLTTLWNRVHRINKLNLLLLYEDGDAMTALKPCVCDLWYWLTFLVLLWAWWKYPHILWLLW